MARHSGKSLVVKNGVDVFGGVRSFNIDETTDTTDLTAAGDAAQTHDTGIPGWSGTITMLADDEAAAKQTLRAGDTITFQGYTEGDATGKSYLSGTASVTGSKKGASYDGEATREYSILGNGALTVAVVGA